MDIFRGTFPILRAVVCSILFLIFVFVGCAKKNGQDFATSSSKTVQAVPLSSPFANLPPVKPDQVRIQGSVQAAPVVGANVRAYEVDSQGNYDPTSKPLGEGTTDASGNYFINLDALAPGKVIVVTASGGKYREEATEKEVELPDGHVMTARVSSLTSGQAVSVHVNVFTEITRCRMERLIREGKDKVEATKQTNQDLCVALGLGGESCNITEISPILPQGQSCTNTKEELLSLALSGVSQYASKLGKDANLEINSLDVMKALNEDFCDGKFDGKKVDQKNITEDVQITPKEGLKVALPKEFWELFSREAISDFIQSHLSQAQVDPKCIPQFKSSGDLRLNEEKAFFQIYPTISSAIVGQSVNLTVYAKEPNYEGKIEIGAEDSDAVSIQDPQDLLSSTVPIQSYQFQKEDLGRKTFRVKFLKSGDLHLFVKEKEKKMQFDVAVSVPVPTSIQLIRPDQPYQSNTCLGPYRLKLIDRDQNEVAAEKALTLRLGLGTMAEGGPDENFSGITFYGSQEQCEKGNVLSTLNFNAGEKEKSFFIQSKPESRPSVPIEVETESLLKSMLGGGRGIYWLSFYQPPFEVIAPQGIGKPDECFGPFHLKIYSRQGLADLKFDLDPAIHFGTPPLEPTRVDPPGIGPSKKEVFDFYSSEEKCRDNQKIRKSKNGKVELVIPPEQQEGLFFIKAQKGGHYHHTVEQISFTDSSHPTIPMANSAFYHFRIAAPTHIVIQEPTGATQPDACLGPYELKLYDENEPTTANLPLQFKFNAQSSGVYPTGDGKLDFFLSQQNCESNQDANADLVIPKGESKGAFFVKVASKESRGAFSFGEAFMRSIEVVTPSLLRDLANPILFTLTLHPLTDPKLKGAFQSVVSSARGGLASGAGTGGTATGGMTTGGTAIHRTATLPSAPLPSPPIGTTPPSLPSGFTGSSYNVASLFAAAGIPPGAGQQFENLNAGLSALKFRDVHFNFVIHWNLADHPSPKTDNDCYRLSESDAVNQFSKTGKITCGSITWKLNPKNAQVIANQDPAKLISYFRKYNEVYQEMKGAIGYIPGGRNVGRIILPLTLNHIIYVLPNQDHIIIQEGCEDGEWYCVNVDVTQLLRQTLAGLHVNSGDADLLIQSMGIDFFSNTFPKIAAEGALSTELLHELGHVFMPVNATGLFWDDSQMEGWADLAGPIRYILNQRSKGEEPKLYSEAHCFMQRIQGAVNRVSANPTLQDPRFYIGKTQQQIEEDTKKEVSDDIREEFKTNECRTYYSTITEYSTSSLTDMLFGSYLANDEEFDSLFGVPSSNPRRNLNHPEKVWLLDPNLIDHVGTFGITYIMKNFVGGNKDGNFYFDVSKHTVKDLSTFFFKLQERAQKGFVGPILSFYQDYVKSHGERDGAIKFNEEFLRPLLKKFSGFNWDSYCLGKQCKKMKENREDFFGFLNSAETGKENVCLRLFGLCLTPPMHNPYDPANYGIPIPIFINSKLYEPLDDVFRNHRSNFFVLFLSSLAQKNLTHRFQALNWPVSQSTRGIIQRHLEDGRYSLPTAFSEMLKLNMNHDAYLMKNVPRFNRAILSYGGLPSLEWKNTRGVDDTHIIGSVQINRSESPSGPFSNCHTSSDGKQSYRDVSISVNKPYFYELVPTAKNKGEMPLSRQIKVEPIRPGECDGDEMSFRSSGMIRCGNIRWDLSPATAASLPDPVAFAKRYDTLFVAIRNLLNKAPYRIATPVQDLIIIREVNDSSSADGLSENDQLKDSKQFRLDALEKRVNLVALDPLDGYVIPIKRSSVFSLLLPAARNGAIPDLLAKSIVKFFISFSDHPSSKDFAYFSMGSVDEWAYVFGVLLMLMKNEVGSGDPFTFDRMGNRLSSVSDIAPFFPAPSGKFIADLIQLYLKQRNKGQSAQFFKGLVSTIQDFHSRKLPKGNELYGKNQLAYLLSQNIGMNLIQTLKELDWPITRQLEELLIEKETRPSESFPDPNEFKGNTGSRPVLTRAVYRRGSGSNEIEWKWGPYQEMLIYRSKTGDRISKQIGKVIRGGSGEYYGKFTEKHIHNLVGVVDTYEITPPEGYPISKPMTLTEVMPIQNVLIFPNGASSPIGPDREIDSRPKITWEHPTYQGYRYTSIVRSTFFNPNFRKNYMTGSRFSEETLLTRVHRDQPPSFVDDLKDIPRASEEVFYYLIDHYGDESDPEIDPDDAKKIGDPVIYRYPIRQFTSLAHDQSILLPQRIDVQSSALPSKNPWAFDFRVINVPSQNGIAFVHSRQKVVFALNSGEGDSRLKYFCKASGSWNSFTQEISPAESGIYTLTCLRFGKLSDSEKFPMNSFSTESIVIIVDDRLPYINLKVDPMPNDQVFEPSPRVKLLWDVRNANRCTAESTQGGTDTQMPHWSGNKDAGVRKQEVVNMYQDLQSFKSMGADPDQDQFWRSTYSLTCCQGTGQESQSQNNWCMKQQVVVNAYATLVNKFPSIRYFTIGGTSESTTATIIQGEPITLTWKTHRLGRCFPASIYYNIDPFYKYQIDSVVSQLASAPKEFDSLLGPVGGSFAKIGDDEWSRNFFVPTGDDESMTVVPETTTTYKLSCVSVDPNDQNLPLRHRNRFVTVYVKSASDPSKFLTRPPPNFDCGHEQEKVCHETDPQKPLFYGCRAPLVPFGKYGNGKCSPCDPGKIYAAGGCVACGKAGEKQCDSNTPGLWDGCRSGSAPVSGICLCQEGYSVDSAGECKPVITHAPPASQPVSGPDQMPGADPQPPPGFVSGPGGVGPVSGPGGNGSPPTAGSGAGPGNAGPGSGGFGPGGPIGGGQGNAGPPPGR